MAGLAAATPGAFCDSTKGTAAGGMGSAGLAVVGADVGGGLAPVTPVGAPEPEGDEQHAQPEGDEQQGREGLGGGFGWRRVLFNSPP